MPAFIFGWDEPEQPTLYCECSFNVDQQKRAVLACPPTSQGAVLHLCIFCILCFLILVFLYLSRLAHLPGRELSCPPLKVIKSPGATTPRPLFDLLLNLSLELQICQIPLQRLKSSSARGQLDPIFYFTFWLAYKNKICRERSVRGFGKCCGRYVDNWGAQMGVGGVRKGCFVRCYFNVSLIGEKAFQ